MTKEKITLQDTLKSQDTEEWIDLLFYRPLGYRWALFFRNMHITPNTVTLLSIFLGVAAGVCFYFSSLWLNLAGMFLLVWANTYDSTDGQLARMTGQYSRLGRILDGAAGDCWFVAIYAAICLRLMPSWGIWIWLPAAAAGYCHTKQAAMGDYLRNFHLLFVGGKSRSELDDSTALEERYRLSGPKKNRIEQFVLRSYISYTKGQEAWTPGIQALRRALKDPQRTTLPPGFGEAFRQASRPLMKYANILSFNTRVAVLFLTLFAGCPWLYFVFELTILNILLIYMLHRYETICKRFTLRLRGND
jgi:hypothetical protein